MSRYNVTGQEVTALRYGSNAVEVDVRAGREGLLVISDTYLPGWHAGADGHRIPLFRVNGKFRGMVVPAGTTKLVLSYSAPGFRVGLTVSILTLFALAAAHVIGTLLQRRARRHPEGDVERPDDGLKS